MQSMKMQLSIEGLKKSFKANSVLQGACFEAQEGEIIGLIGTSGCGKSTLLKILVGYYKADAGKVMFNKKICRDLKRVAGYTTQENSFYEKLSVIENMQYYGRLYSLSNKQIKEKSDDLLGKVGLANYQKTLGENLSGGMKRRLDFAISLLHDPSVLVLDEPTTGLDPMLVDQFWRIVNKLGKNKIVIMTTHILSEVEKYCTKVVVMKNGKVIAVLKKKQMKGLEKKFRKLIGK